MHPAFCELLIIKTSLAASTSAAQANQPSDLGPIPPSLIDELCRCLAFHTVESENTAQFMTPPCAKVEAMVTEAKRLIAAAGFQFDALYPASARPVVSSTAETSKKKH